MGRVNEQELGQSIADNLAPKIAEAQGRLQGWAESFIDRLLIGNQLRLTIPLGDRTVTVTVELVPKP